MYSLIIFFILVVLFFTLIYLCYRDNKKMIVLPKKDVPTGKLMTYINVNNTDYINTEISRYNKYIDKLVDENKINNKKNKELENKITVVKTDIDILKLEKNKLIKSRK